MATGGYNASYEESPSGFGSEAVEDGHNAERTGGGISSAPLVGIDYKRYHRLVHVYRPLSISRTVTLLVYRLVKTLVQLLCYA